MQPDVSTRAAKWHQSGAATGHSIPPGQGASIRAPEASSAERRARTSAKPAGVPGSIATIAARAACHMRGAWLPSNSPSE